MKNFIAVLSALKTREVVAFVPPALPSDLSDVAALVGYSQTLLASKAKWETDNAINPTTDCAIACAHLMASLGDVNFAAIAEDAMKRAYTLKGKVSVDMVELREEIAIAFKLGNGMPSALRAVYQFAAKIDAGELEAVAAQKVEGDKLGLTESARRAAWVIGNGDGKKFVDNLHPEGISLLSMLYGLDGKNEDGTDKTSTTPPPAPSKADKVEARAKGKGK